MCRLLLACFLLVPYLTFAQTAKQTIPLLTGWQFRQVGRAAWQPATVPGCVHTDLLALKQIPEPFVGQNEKELQWIGQTDWDYQLTFEVAPAQLQREHLELVFEGLDTYADITLNDQSILRADNMFRTWRVDVKAALRAGQNRLVVHFRSPINEVAPRIQHLPQQRSSDNETVAQAALGEPKPYLTTSVYTRKAPYMYGWDWGPRFVTSGIWKNVMLEAWNNARLADFHLRQDSLSPQQALLTAVLTVEAAQAGPARVQLTQTNGPAGLPMTLNQTVTLHAGRNEISLPITLAKPQFWYPNGYGAQPLYLFQAKLLTNSGQPLDEKQKRIGLRTIRLRQDQDAWGTSFEFVVNGVPVYAKGANWIPADAFPSRVTPARYRQLLQNATAAHMNMLRVWGGGIYENDTFYDLCDELGLLVWQEFMFACSIYPADLPFLENVRFEARDQLLRLRDHPSLALWCGNNENETAWQHWGWRKTYPVAWWQDYLTLFHDVLPKEVATYAPNLVYRTSSPSANLLKEADSQDMGDMHYWGVWAGGEPPTSYEKQHPRFMSEYGFQAFPDLTTIRTFAEPADFDLESPVMRAHQKNGRGNQIIQTNLLRDYGPPRNFPALVYLSQVQQAEAIRIGAEHFRRLRPQNMGGLFWQLDDCWPVASWSSVDYYGHWKALQYAAKRFYAPLLVSPHEAHDSLRVYVVSDQQQALSARLRVRLLDFQGQVLYDTTQAVTVQPLASRAYFALPTARLLRGHDPRRVVLHCALLNGNEVVADNQRYFAPAKELALPRPTIKTQWRRDVRRGLVLTLTTSQLARAVQLTNGGEYFAFSDNYFDLLPGQPKEIVVASQPPAMLRQLQKQLRLYSLIEARGQ